MDIEAILREAVRLVDCAEVPGSLHEIAFDRILAKLLSTGEVRPGSDRTTTTEEDKVDQVKTGSVLSQIAAKCGLAVEKIKEVYDEGGERGLEVVAPVGKLESGKAPATKQISLLVAGGRQLGGLEEWTDAKEIRITCEHYGKYDSANFAGTVRQMQDVFSYKGSGQRRQVRTNLVGVNSLKMLLSEITGSQTM